jgi:hypothetical protein
MYVVGINNELYGPFANHELAQYWAKGNTQKGRYKLRALSATV